jgi:DNA-binding winged helix-turn-helix (wHTH) protein
MDAPLRFGPFELDIANVRLVRDGQPLTLPPKAFALLACLAARPGQLVSKDELLDTVWGRRYVSEGVIKTVVSELRAALDDDPRQPRWIETVARRGYRFVGDVAAAAAAPDPQGGAPGGLIGREAELGELQSAWKAAQAGQRRFVLVAGEPGVGKSALLAAFVAGLEQGRVVSGQCVEAYGSDEPYLPVLEALGQMCSAEPALVPTLRRFAPTWLVQLPWHLTEADRITLQREVTGATQDRMLREAGALLDHLSQDQPLLLVLEDLHWADAATVRLLDVLARRRGPARLMIVCSFRPADVAIADHPFGDLRRELRLHRLVDEVVLEGLDPPRLAALLDQRFGPPALPPAFVQALHQHTEGLPLFVLGVLDELVADGALVPREEGGWRLAGDPAAPLPVPASLAGVIEKQFMRLPAEVRALLETAALAAPEFQHLEIAEAMSLPADTVRERLEGLLRRQIWLRAAGAEELPDGRWALGCTFEHALIRHTLARRVGPSLRVERHRRLANALEAAWGVRVGEIATELAMHAEQGHEPLRAARYCALAARNALQRRAAREALAMARRGLDLIEPLDTAARREAELPLLALRLTATMLTEGLSSPAARPLVAQALALVQGLPVSPDTAALWHVALLVHVTGRLPGTGDLAQRFFERAQAGGDAQCRAAAHNMVGVNLLHGGHLTESITQFEASLALAEGSPPPAAPILLRDPRIEALSYLCLTETVAGRFARARARSAALDAFIAAGTDLISEGLGRWFQVYAHVYRRDAAALKPVSEHIVALLEARGASPALQPHRMALGWARAQLGEAAEGAALAADALARYRAQGSRQGLVGLCAMVGEALRLAGDREGALACVRDGEAAAAELGDAYARSTLMRLAADLALDGDPGDTQAEALLGEAAALARHQGAVLIEAGVWARLAPLQAMRGQREAARQAVEGLLARTEADDDAPVLTELRRWLAQA